MKNKGFKVTAIILTLAVTLIAHPFLVVNALSTNHGHQTFTGGRLEWELNTYDSVQDVVVNGTTFRAAGIMIFEYYLTNTSTGTIRLYWTGFNSGWYNAMNIYTYGATISNVVYSGSAGITFKINEPTDRVTVIMSFNNTDMNTSIQGISSFSNVTSLITVTDSTESTLSDIDVKLANIDYTLQDILTAIQNDNTSIINYLSAIEAYSEYLDDISLALDDIDNTIDTITYNVSNITFKGWTETGASYDNSQNKSHSGGYYAFENVNFSAARLNDIFKIILPIRIVPYGYIGPDLIEFYYYSQRSGSFTRIYPDEILYFQTYSYFTMYLTFNITGDGTIQDTNPIFFRINTNLTTYYTKNEYLYFGSISPDDIEYWTLKNAFTQNMILEALNNITVGSTDTSTTTNLDNLTSDLNQQIQDSNQAQQSIDNMVDDFNLNFDLDSYRFTFDDDFISYFKLKLTDLYNIQELRPFYIIPIVLFIVWRLLSG